MIRALILSLALSGCAYTGSKPAIVACQAFDTWTTVRGLEVGATEANPVLGDSQASVIRMKVLVTSIFLLLHHYWKGDERERDIAFSIANGITCAAGVHNLRVIRKQKDS